jgi:hypothetical protein
MPARVLSDREPPELTPATWRKIAPITSRQDYSRFMLHDLSQHVQTSHVLTIQWDGYVLDPAGWDPVYLAYDYIGAPWPQFLDGKRVGNGGFSLRSRRLIEACAKLPITDEAEDIAICRTHRARLERELGLRFAPEDVARRFAYERTQRTGREFGFHGAFNLVDHLSRGESAPLFASLEARLLSQGEHREIRNKALCRGDMQLAMTMWRRMRSPEVRLR